ncbi:serine hydrolase domain-containing protein [Kineococcus glutinatus]|uniref:Serine hydrolase n=1 Tax=Kineococcus glutinatus TaxID=1070872 RepID=A0ABP9HYB0_9ACTN
MSAPGSGTFEPVRDLLDGRVAAGDVPGYVAAISHRGRVEVLVGGAHSPGGAPLRPDAQFRTASLTKPVAGVLVCALVEDGVLALDDEVARWLPELAAPRVLRDPGGPLADTVAAHRPVLVRDLVTMTFGLGWVDEPGPLRNAVADAGLEPGPFPPEVGHDEFAARLGALPLAHQPGERWMYHTGSDVLAVLLARATGRPLGEVLDERVLRPLGMTSTAFRATDPGRVATLWETGPGGALRVMAAPDPAAPPVFESLSCGLLSTAQDLLALFTALLAGGRGVLSAASVVAMTSDQLTPAQRAAAGDGLDPGTSWGLHTGVTVEPVRAWDTVGRFGWSGGLGTTAYADPAHDLVAVLMTQRLWSGDPEEFDAFHRCMHSCLPGGTWNRGT